MNSSLFIRSIHEIKEILLIGFCLFIMITKVNSQIQPDQIGFPPNSTQLWLVGIDTLNTSPTYGLGRWYNFAQLLDSIASTGIWDHDWYEEGTTTPPNAITDDMFHTGNVGINNGTPAAKLDIISSDATPALVIKGSTSYPNLFQFLKPDGTNLLRGQWDGGNFHHYLDGNIYYNLNGHGIVLDGNSIGPSLLNVGGGASIWVNGTPTIGLGLMWAGPISYASSGTPLTSIYPLEITSWAWNGTDGYSIQSNTIFKQTQLSSAAGDARFDILNHSNSSVFSILTASGNIGVGTNSPSARLHIISPTEQIRTGYDASNYFSTTVNSSGLATFNSEGSGPGFLFNDKIGYSTNGGTPTTLAGRDGTYFSDISLGTGLTLSSGTLSVNTTAISDHDWYEAGNTPPDNIADEMYHTGDVHIGYSSMALGGALNVAGRIDQAFPSSNVTSIAIGKNAGNTSWGVFQPYNIAIGINALQSATGGGNIAIGKDVLTASGTSDYNVGIGTQALSSGATRFCVAVGYEALKNTTGSFSYNVGLGYQAGKSVTTGVNNVYIGTLAGSANTGNDNVIIGTSAGASTTGSGNILIGKYAGSNHTGDNVLVIDNNLEATPSNHFIYGDMSVPSLKFNSSLQVTDEFFDSSGDAGTSGQLLSSTGSTTNWIDPSAANIKINNLQAADGTNTIDNAAYQQEWQWLSLAGGSGLKLSSTSASASGSTQKLFEVSLSGSNTNSNEVSYGGYFSNAHNGTSPTNFGVYGTVSNGSNISAGVKGEATSNIGVRGMSDSSIGVYGSSSSNYGVQGSATGTGTGVLATCTTNSGLPLSVMDIGGATNTVEVMVDINHNVTGTAANGVGSSITFSTPTNTAIRLANSIKSKWIDVTDGARTSQLIISGVSNMTDVDYLILSDTSRVNAQFRAKQFRNQWRANSGTSLTITSTDVNGQSMADTGLKTAALPDATSSTIGLWFNIANVSTSGKITVSAPGSGDSISGSLILNPGESGIWECAANNYWIKN